MRLRVIHFLEVLFISLSFAGFSQKIKFDQFTVKDGLLSDEVYNLHQDKKGYIWAFTNYGVLKYNGVEFKQVLKNLPFSESFIYACYERSGKMWVANAKAKIYEIRNDSAFLVEGAEKISENLRKDVSEIYQLYVDDSLNIYAITKHYSYKFVKANQYRAINISNLIPPALNYILYEKSNDVLPVLNYNENDTVYCGGRQRIVFSILDENGRLSDTMAVACNVSNFRHVKKFGKTFYFIHHNHLGRIKGKDLKIIPFNSIILNFTKDSDNHLWVACYNDGLYELNENDSVVNHYFEDMTVNYVLSDFQNGLWVSTTGSGLFHCKELNNKYFSEDSPLGKSISFIKQFGDTLFIGTSASGVFMIRHDEIKRVIPPHVNNEPIEIIRHGTEFSVAFRYKLESFRFSGDSLIKNSVISNSIIAIQMVHLSEDTMVCLRRKSIVMLAKKQEFKTIPLNNKAYAYSRVNGVTLLAMEYGVWELKGDKLFRPAYLEATKDILVNSIRTDPHGNRWFSTSGAGIFKLINNREMHHYSTADGLPSDIVNDLTFTDKGHLLLSTNKGLYYSEKNNSGSFTWIKIFNGSTRQAAFINNKFYSATKHGLIVRDEGKKEPSTLFHLNLATVSIRNIPVSPQKLNDLTHDENNIDFKFDLISFNDEKLDLSYKLSGPVQDSGSTQSNEIKFRNLLPGMYELTVTPNPSDTNKIKIVIPFSIIPAIWQTGWFALFIYVLLILMAWIASTYVYRYFKTKEQKRTEANRLINEYKLIALKAQINPHFMSNCLTAIQHLIINNKLEEATAYIAKFGLLVRQILNFSTKSLITLKEELTIATLNMELEQLRFEKKFHFEVHVGEGINLKDIYVPALLLNPIIENAIWHGLLPLKSIKQGQLIIETRIRAGTLELSIEDNGAGRQGKPHQLGNTKESKGLRLTEQRLSNVNYLFNVNTSGIIYEDLFIDGKPAGTRVTITLPLTLTPLKHE